MASSQKTCLNFMLLGRTGAGKSSTGDTILGRKCFKSAFSFKSCTKIADKHCNEFLKCIITVVDTPGVFDTHNGMGQILTNIYDGISRIPEGFHGILLVVKLGDKLTMELIETIKVLKDFFGVDTFKKYCIVSFTFGDMFPELNNDNIQDWCKNTDNIDPGSELYQLLDECEFRVVVFCNNDLSRREESVNKLLGYLKPEYPCFKNERIQMTADGRDDIVTRSFFPQQRAKIQTRLSLLEAAVENSLNNNENSNSHDKILLDLDELLKTIKMESKGTDLMKDLEVEALNVKSEIEKLPKDGPERSKELKIILKKINWMKVSGGAACTFGAVTGGGIGASASLTAVGVVGLIPGIGWGVALGFGTVALVTYGIYALTRQPDSTNKKNEVGKDEENHMKKCQ